MPGRTLSDSCFSHIVNAPIERVDIADWLFHLTNDEYKRCCPPAHIAAGTTTTEDGRPMPINVETIGDSLMVHQYVVEVIGRNLCRLASTSDVFSAARRTTAQVVWELSVEPLDGVSCEYVNHLILTATDDLLALLDVHGIPLAESAAMHHEAAIAHNEKETPLLAESIERHALRATET